MNEPPAEAALVRRAGLDDLDAVCTLAQALNVLHHAAWPQFFAPAAQPSIDVVHWRESILGDGRATFMADLAGEPVGFIACGVAEDLHSLLQPVCFGRVNSVCVAAGARGRGVGSALMAAAEDWARRQGATDMRLVVWDFNAAAQRLYEELGYTVRSHTMGKPL